MRFSLGVFILLLLPILLYSQATWSKGNADSPVSGLPVPPGDVNIPQPSGEAGNLVVLDWAGFKSATTYTYDDAQPSHIDHYDELQATGVRMTFFISTNVNWIPDSDKLWSQAVKDGHEMGNHTVSHPHPDLTGSCFGQPLASIDAEIDDCTKYIVSHFGQSDVWTMAAPFGDFGWRDPASQRFFLNRGVGGGTVAPNSDNDPFNMPCYMANGGDTAEKFNELIDGARSKGHWLIFLFHSIRPTADNWYAPVEIEEITNSIEHAKALKDVWIDTFANVGAYWMGQKIFSAITPVKSGKDTIWRWTLPEHFPKGKYLRVTVDGGTLIQGGKTLKWDPHGYYEVALDAGELTLSE